MKREKVVISILAVVVLVCSGIGAAIILSELDSDYAAIQDDGLRMAPGTVITYSVMIDNGGVIIEGTSTYELLGQNPSGIMFRLSYNLQNPDGSEYEVDTRIRLTNDSTTVTVGSGIGNVSTIDGKFRMPFIEYMSSGERFRDYFNPYTNIMYLSVSMDSASRVELISKDVVWQPVGSYTPSAALGMEAIYAVSGTSNGASVSGTHTELIAAEDGDGRFGVRVLTTIGHLSSISYFFDAMSSGGGAEKIGEVSMNTIDGLLNLSIYTYTIDDVTHTRYIDDTTGICYRVIISSGADILTMDLISRGINNSLWE
ncbi:MAG: hypothetical protein FWD92_05345 [Methanomassiliicoccaceae archaeon]|nr:hypothetical protein [Methanomassiliicoccaceae archaeon]